MKKIISMVAGLILLASTAFAGPFLVCDPQEGVTEYVLEFTQLGLEITVPAQADGSLRYDLAEWTGPHGWYEGRVMASVTYEVTDGTSGETSSATDVSTPTGISLKIPNKKAASGFRVTQ